jgi:hypothetical protein
MVDQNLSTGRSVVSSGVPASKDRYNGGLGHTPSIVIRSFEIHRSRAIEQFTSKSSKSNTNLALRERNCIEATRRSRDFGGEPNPQAFTKPSSLQSKARALPHGR